MVSIDSMSSYLGLFQDRFSGDFPGSPVVKTPCFHCRGKGSIPGWGTKLLHAVVQPKEKKTPQVFRGKSTHTVEPLGVFLYYDHKDLNYLRTKRFPFSRVSGHV